MASFQAATVRFRAQYPIVPLLPRPTDFQNFDQLPQGTKRLIRETFSTPSVLPARSQQYIDTYHLTQSRAMAISPFANLFYQTGAKFLEIAQLADPQLNRTSMDKNTNLNAIHQVAKVMLKQFQDGLTVIVGQNQFGQGPAQGYGTPAENIFL